MHGNSIAMDFAQRRVRDQDVPEGQWHGSHPAGSRYFEESNGELTIYSAKDEPMCIYSPGSFRIHEDAAGVDVARLGNHNPNPDPEVPERIDVQDSAPELLRRLNQRNADFWAGKSTWAAESAIVNSSGAASDLTASSVIVTGTERDSPQGQQATLRALNERNRRFYGAKR